MSLIDPNRSAGPPGRPDHYTGRAHRSRFAAARTVLGARLALALLRLGRRFR